MTTETKITLPSRACGLDFGTSNTTLGLARGNTSRLAVLEGDETTLPSAVFFDFENHRPLYGRSAVAAYVAGVEGRLMRSLKSVLGTALIDEDTMLLRRRIGFREVIGQFIGHAKTMAEASLSAPLDYVVHGRPVHFVDGDAAADQRAESALADIARAQGFREVSFQFEPIAAALHYELQTEREEIALIADIGGGTSDFSIVRLGPQRMGRPDRGSDILANDGVRIGGTDLDRLLSLKAVMPHLGYQSSLKAGKLLTPNHWYSDLATWSKINFLYVPVIIADIRRARDDADQPKLLNRLLTVLEEHLGHSLAMRVEAAKIALSEARLVDIDLSAVEPGLDAPASRGQLADAIASPVNALTKMVEACLSQAGITADAIDAVFLTGGSTLLPAIRHAIIGAVPTARIVEGDKFGAVGLGLTLEAARRYG